MPTANTRVTLKNVKFYSSLSEETNCFTATVYFDGKKIGDCRNDGHGGSTHLYFSDREKEAEVISYCRSLPPISFGEFSLDCSLDLVLDGCLGEWLSKREGQRLEKDFEKGICYGTPDRYYISSFTIGKKKASISDVLRSKDGLKVLRDACEEFKGQGHVILNNNLPFPV